MQAVGNYQIKAIVQNNCKDGINLLKPGGIFHFSAVQGDDGSSVLPVPQYTLFGSSSLTKRQKTTPFHSLASRSESPPKRFKDSAIKRIAAGQSVEISIDVAQAGDLSTGSQLSVNAAGSLSVVGQDGITGAMAYRFSCVEVSVGGRDARAPRTGPRPRPTSTRTRTWARSRAATTELDNADTYALVANAVYAGC